MHKTLYCLLFFLLIGCSNQESQNQIRQSAPKEKVENPPHQVQTEYKAKKPAQPKQQRVILNVPILKQNPELKYGCEVTSLAMVLQYAGIKVDKMTLAQKINKDNDPVVKDRNGHVIQWGNPAHGFVGDMTGSNMGYAVYVQPTQRLLETYLPGRTLNLTQKPFEALLDQIRKGKPVVTWVTGDFTAPDEWVTWKHGHETVKITYDLHAVVLVGFDPDYVYVNDPLSGLKANKITRESFNVAWNALGRQALSYR